MGIIELDADMQRAAFPYFGWRYRGPRENPMIAEGAPWLPADLVATTAPSVTDCTTMILGILARVYRDAPWMRRVSQGRMEIGDRAHPWSNLDELVRLGIARALPEGTAPEMGRWHVAQGWSGLVEGVVVDASRGHSWMPFGRFRVFECTTRASVRGVSWNDSSWTTQAARHEHARLVVLEPPR